MKDEEKTKEQLVNELVELRRRLTELEVREIERKRREEALRESERRFHQMAENIPVVLTGLSSTTASIWPWLRPPAISTCWP